MIICLLFPNVKQIDINNANYEMIMELPIENTKKKETTVGNNNRLQKKQLNIAQTSFIED